MELKIMTWNVKGESSLAWNNQYKIESKVVDKILNQEAAVIVLTAFVIAEGLDYLFKTLHEKDYIWFQQSRTGKNGILIAVKRELINEEELIKQVYEFNVIVSEVEGCNILRILFPMRNKKKLCVLGCRMETGGEESLLKQYDSERECFDNVLIPFIDKMHQEDYFIVCGDFNNARCLGKLTKRFDSKNYYGKAQINYNLNIIKDKFDDLGFAMADCNNGDGIPTHNSFFPDDHIFVKGFSVSRCVSVGAEGLSDHDILIANCSFE